MTNKKYKSIADLPKEWDPAMIMQYLFLEYDFVSPHHCKANCNTKEFVWDFNNAGLRLRLDIYTKFPARNVMKLFAGGRFDFPYSRSSQINKTVRIDKRTIRFSVYKNKPRKILIKDVS